MAFAPVNILSRFKTTEIWPINRNTIQEVNFTLANVTDRPYNESDKTTSSTKNDGMTSTLVGYDQQPDDFQEVHGRCRQPFF